MTLNREVEGPAPRLLDEHRGIEDRGSCDLYICSVKGSSRSGSAHAIKAVPAIERDIEQHSSSSLFDAPRLPKCSSARAA